MQVCASEERRDADGNNYYIFPDRLGSNRVITDDEGNPVWTATYFPFGDAQRIIPSGDFDNLYRFADMEYDTEAGLYNTLFRQYSPTLGRWMGPDPLGGDIGDPQSLNRYSYVLNSPTNYTDLLGLHGRALRYEEAYAGSYTFFELISIGSGISYAPGSMDLSVVSVKIGGISYAPAYTPYYNPGGAIGIATTLGGAGSGGSYGGGGGGNGGGGGCAPAQQQVIFKSLQDLTLSLLNDPECMAFLSSGGKDPIVEMNLATFTASGDLPSSVDARTIMPTGQVLISSTGSFFLAQGTTSYSGVTLLGGISQVRSLILLHEIGHLAKSIVPERGSWRQTVANNEAIVSHCKKALGIQ